MKDQMNLVKNVISSLNQESTAVMKIAKALELHENMLKQREEHKNFLEQIALDMLREARRKSEG